MTHPATARSLPAPAKAALSPSASTATSPARRSLHAPSTPAAASSSSAAAPAVLAWEGYLQKRSDWLKHWETYYFVLRGRSLYCYLSEDDARRQPAKSKIKKGKFGFADRVTLTRVWDVEESAAGTAALASAPSTPSVVAAAAANGGATPPAAGSTTTASTSTDAAAAAAAPATAPLSPPQALGFRFTFETEKGHQLHFRTNSEASKHVWLEFAANGIADAPAFKEPLVPLVVVSATPSTLPPLLPLLERPISDFYRGYEYFYAALSDRVTMDLTCAFAAPVQGGFPTPDGGVMGLSPGVVESGSMGPATSKKPGITFRAVVPGQPLARTRVMPPADHALARFLSLLSPDIILRSNYLPMVPFEGTYRGFAGVLEYFTRLSQSACYEQFVVERIEEESDEDYPNEADPSVRTRPRSSRVVVASGRETMHVRFNQATFVQQWTHKLHFKRTSDGLRISRWEIFGDVVASSVVFKMPGSSTNLVLPSLSERIRESFVGGHIVSIKLHHVADVRSKDVRRDRFFVRCSLDTNEFDGVWHTEAQSRAAAPSESPADAASTPSLTYSYNQELHLQFDRLSRDDNTILLIEFCREGSREVVARTHVNLATFLNVKTQPASKWRRRSRSHSHARPNEVHNYVLSNDHQSFLGKLALGLSISSLSAAGRRQQRLTRGSRNSRNSHRLSFESEISLEGSGYGDEDEPSTPSSSRGLRALANSFASLTTSAGPPANEPEEMMHQFVINGVRYQLAEKYRMVKIVGKGTYGEVIAASDFVNGGTFAIKKLAQFLRHPKVALLALREIKLMNGIGSHPCLMDIHELQRPLDYEHFEDLYIIQQLMETDLCRIIHSKELLSDDQVQYFMYQLLCGINYLHSADVLHRDLKPSNILVNSDCRIKICDFGLARHADARDLAEGLSEYVVTRWYRAPELLLANMYTKAIDMWSVGCIFAELLGRRIMFPGTSYVDQLKVIVDVVGTPTTFNFIDNPAARRYAGRQFLIQCDKVPKADWRAIFPDANPDGLDLLDKLLQFDPAQRISAEEALNHPYVSAWRDPRMEAKCPPEVAAALTQFDYGQVANDPPQLKHLLYEEVMRSHVVRRQQQQQQQQQHSTRVW